MAKKYGYLDEAYTRGEQIKCYSQVRSCQSVPRIHQETIHNTWLADSPGDDTWIEQYTTNREGYRVVFAICGRSEVHRDARYSACVLVSRTVFERNESFTQRQSSADDGKKGTCVIFDLG
jgi:hypothetical protein